MNTHYKTNLKIILTDDDKDDRELFEYAIKELELSCTLGFCENGQELLDHLNDATKEIPDIVFLDLNMPVLSGLKTLEEIRSIENFKKIPIIAIYSTSVAISDKKASLQYGANAYITKPSDFSELKAILKKVIGTNWLEREEKPDMESFIISVRK